MTLELKKNEKYLVQYTTIQHINLFLSTYFFVTFNAANKLTELVLVLYASSKA
jgi:hypothetical protein